MPYNLALADRVRIALGPRSDLVEQKMFGGLAFMLGGKICCGVIREELVVRVGPHRYEEALANPDARVMDLTGRPMRGYVFVKAAGCASVVLVEPWILQGIRCVEDLKGGSRGG